MIYYTYASVAGCFAEYYYLPFKSQDPNKEKDVCVQEWMEAERRGMREEEWS